MSVDLGLVEFMYRQLQLFRSYISHMNILMGDYNISHEYSRGGGGDYYISHMNILMGDYNISHEYSRGGGGIIISAMNILGGGGGGDYNISHEYSRWGGGLL